MSYYNSKAYDINLGENDERLFQLYDVYCSSEYIKEPVLVETIDGTNNLEALVKECKIAGYKNIYEIYNMNQSFECDNFLADSVTSLFKSRFKILKKFYYSQEVNFKNYLIGGVIYVDMNTGKEYYIRTKNFGIEHEMILMHLLEKGYININDTELKNTKEIGYFPRRINKEPNLKR